MRSIQLPRYTGLAVVLAFLVAGCGPGGPIGVHLRPAVRRPQRSVVLFICDGLGADQAQIGCDEGWLPNIRKRFVDNGLRVENAITCVPSITYGILTTYATGLTPARHGILANRWFDRRLRLLREYAYIKHYRKANGDFWVPTIYERIQPRVSVSIQSPIHRGVTKNVANWAQSGVRWFFHDFTAVDKLTATTLQNVGDWANRSGVWPDLLVCYFPGVDSIGHAHGVDSNRYRVAAEHVDYQIGRVCDWLEAEGMLESATLVLVSDHGMTPVREVIDLKNILRKDLGRRVAALPVQGLPFEDRYHHFERFDTALAVSANRFAAVHFRGPLGWNDPLEPQQVREILESAPEGRHLWDRPGVDLTVYALSENEVELRSPRGAARVAERMGTSGLEYRYVPVPDDVFGYLEDAELAEFVAEGFHSSRDWLHATCEHNYPDVVPQLVPLMRNCRSGQVVLFAATGYSFAREKSGHGGIQRDEMHIMMMLAGPGIDAGTTLHAARATDLVPTMLGLLGCEVPDDGSLEGLSLLSASDAEHVLWTN